MSCISRMVLADGTDVTARELLHEKTRREMSSLYVLKPAHRNIKRASAGRYLCPRKPGSNTPICRDIMSGNIFHISNVFHLAIGVISIIARGRLAKLRYAS